MAAPLQISSSQWPSLDLTHGYADTAYPPARCGHKGISSHTPISRSPIGTSSVTSTSNGYRTIPTAKGAKTSRYLVVSVEGPYCFVKKFSGNQLRASSYKVKTIECQRIPSDFPVATHTPRDNLQSDDDDLPIDPPIPPVDVLTALTLPMFDDLPQPLQDTRDDGLDNPVRNNS